MQSRKEIIQAVAAALHSYGYQVYISSTGEYGFYTDGTKVVSFGGHSMFTITYSGNYKPSNKYGTGWCIAENAGIPSQQDAANYIKDKGLWANPTPKYSTPEQHMYRYELSSGYKLYAPT